MPLLYLFKIKNHDIIQAMTHSEACQDAKVFAMTPTARLFAKAGKHSITRLAKEYELLGYSDVADYVTITEGGEIQFNPLDTLPKGKSRAIKKIREKTTITESKDGQTLTKYSTIEFELHSKTDALHEIVDIMSIKPAAKLDIGGPGIESILERVYAKRSGKK